MTRYNKMQQAREDLSKGLISDEEFRDIMEECDFADLRKYARCGYEKLKSKEIS